MNGNSLDFLKSPKELGKNIAKNIKQLRLKFNLSQQSLATKSGVSLGSLKRFESSGDISLKHLILLAIALDRKQDLLDIFKENVQYTSIKEVLEQDKIKIRKRGRTNV